MMKHGIVAAIVFSTALAGTSSAQTPAQGNQRVLVMPFEYAAGEGRAVWLGEAAAVLIADDINAHGGNAITRQERQQAFERLQVPPAATLTDATIIRIGQIVGATEVVVGSVQLDGETLGVHARAIALEAGRIQADVTERGPLPDLFAVVERVAQKLLPLRMASASTAITPPPIAAFEAYVKGLLARKTDTAVNFLNLALKTDPTYDRARLALWDVYTEAGEHERALEAVRAVPPTSRWARRAKFAIGLSSIGLKKLDDAFTAFKSIADGEPTATVMNNLGVVQLTRAAALDAGTPTYYFNRAVDLDPEDPDYSFNLGYANWLAHDPQSAVYWLRETVRRNPADGDAHFVLGTALLAGGSSVEGNRERDLARRLSSTYDAWIKRSPADPVPKDLARVKNELEPSHAQRLEAALASSGQRDQRDLARFYFERAERLSDQGNDSAAISELGRAIYLSPYLAEAHLLLGRLHLRNGRLREAIDALKIAVWSADTAAAHVALGDAYRQSKDLPAARAEAERALALDPQSSDARRLRDMVQSP
jgi:tetratricopeptide (TPR) repeat protein